MGASAVPPPPRREDSAVLAAALAERLLTRLKAPEAVAAVDRIEIPLGDVETEVDRFATQNRILARLGEPVPCLVTGRGVPIPLDIGIGEPFTAPYWGGLGFRGYG